MKMLLLSLVFAASAAAAPSMIDSKVPVAHSELGWESAPSATEEFGYRFQFNASDWAPTSPQPRGLQTYQPATQDFSPVFPRLEAQNLFSLGAWGGVAHFLGLIGASYFKMHREGRKIGFGIAEQDLHLLSAPVGARTEFLVTPELNPFVTVLALPSYVLIPQSAMGPALQTFTLPVGGELGMLIQPRWIRPVALSASAFLTRDWVSGDRFEDFGAKIGLEIFWKN